MKTTRCLYVGIIAPAAVCLLLVAAPCARAQLPGKVEGLNASIVGDNVSATAVQPDGKIIIAGSFTSVLGVLRSNIARLNADGSLDTSFNPKANGSVTSVAVQADGKILLGGAFTTLQPNGAAAATTRQRIARVNADGSLDTGFNPKADNSVMSVAVQTDGKILLGGGFTTLQPNGAATSTSRQRIARVNADGSLDTGFDPKANDSVYNVTVQADGKILLGGFFTTLQPNGAAVTTTRQYVARVNADGSLDTSFNPNADSIVWSMAVQADGKILLGGWFNTLQPNGAASPTTRNCIARINADGTIDTSFNPNVNAQVHGIAVQADGRILLGGAFSTLQPNGAASATTRQRIARVNADGSLDSFFDPNANGFVYSVAIQADGKILLGGDFTTFEPNAELIPTSRNRLARLYNDAATQSLSAPDATQVQWQRGGASPQVSLVTFEKSTNGGINWTSLGSATRIGTTSNWQLTGLTLPASGQLRARGRTTCGFFNGGSGLVESVVSFTVSGGTPAPAITEISPNPVPSSASQQIVTINGSNFVNKPTVTLTWTGQPNYSVPSAQVTFMSASQMQMAITVGSIPDNWTAKITNPDGQQSNTVPFQVLNNLPNSPANMEAQSFSNRVELGWEDNSTNETGFKIERRTGAGAYAQIATTGANATSSAFYTDNTTSPRTTYTYRVRAYNANGNSGYTNEVTATTPGGPPGAFTLSNDPPVWDASIPGPKVQLNWTASTDVGAYALYRNGSVYQAGIAGTSFLNSANLTGGATYTYFIRASNADGTTDSNTIVVTMPTPAPAPEIGVQQPLNTNIVDGGIKSFGSLNVGANTSLTFIIKNTGNANLTGLTIATDGSSANQFSVTSNPTAPVSGPTGSTTFNVRFAPTSEGTKTAAIHIANNDSNENPFDITLTGTGVAILPLPVSLAIYGPAAVGASGTAGYTCMATFPDSSTSDITSQVVWGVIGGPGSTYMTGSTLNAGSGSASTATITANFTTNAGSLTATKSVAISTGLSVGLHSVTSPYASGSGNILNYHLQATAIRSGGTGNLTVSWKLDNVPVGAGDTLALDDIVAAAPGNHELKVILTDATALTAQAATVVLFPKATQTNEKFPMVGTSTLANPGQLFAVDAVTGYTPVAARTTNGLVVIIHGMDSGVTTDSTSGADWMKRMAEEIAVKLPGAATPNIMLYDWNQDANASGIPIKMLQAAKDGVAIEAWPPNASFRQKLLSIGEASLGIVGWLEAEVGAGLAWDMRLVALIGKGDLHGQALADYLAGEILDGRVDPDAPIHLIGHSAGGFVAANCGRLLMKSDFLQQQQPSKKPMNLQVTTLDTPFLKGYQVTDIRTHGGRFERNVSSVIGQVVPSVVLYNSSVLEKAFAVPNWRNLAVASLALQSAYYALQTGPKPGFEGSSNYHSGADIEVSGYLDIPAQHEHAHEWYIHTIQTPNSFGEGFYYSPFPGGYPFPAAASIATSGSVLAASGEAAASPPAALSGFSSFGNVVESSGTYTLTEQGNAGIYQSVTLPMNASTVKFRVQFTQPGDGDFIEVSFGDHLSLGVIADGSLVRAGLVEFELPVIVYGGETGQLLFKLNGVGADNAVVVIDNITITTADDADGDGLMFAQETAFGTDPRYPDSDADGLDDAYETNVNLTNPLLADSDGDGMSDAQEITAGTNATNATSVFATTGASRSPTGDFTITWAAKSGKTYRVQRSDTPYFADYTVVGDNIPGVEPTTNFTDNTVPVNTERVFYRVEVQ